MPGNCPATARDAEDHGPTEDNRKVVQIVLANRSTLDEMAATGEKFTFLRLARTARVSNWLVYAEGLREHIEEAIKKQSGAAQREAEVGSHTSAESLVADLELATAELRILRAERDQLKSAMARLRETEAERDRLREALKETEEKPESTLKESRSSSSHRSEK